MQTVQLGNVTVSRLILGGNPFGGFSHQNPDRDREMLRYYTTDRIKATMRQAEALGINTFLGRADAISAARYWNTGMRVAPSSGSPRRRQSSRVSLPMSQAPLAPAPRQYTCTAGRWTTTSLRDSLMPSEPLCNRSGTQALP